MDAVQIRSMLDAERREFIDRFTAVGLSTVTRNIVVNAIPQLKGEEDRALFASPNFNSKVTNTAAKIIQANFKDQLRLAPEDMNDQNFFDNAAAFLKKNAIVEADYRFDKTLNKIEKQEIDSDDQEVGLKIADEFKSLGYSSPGLADQVRESWKAMFGREMDDIVNQIKGDVQAEVTEAEDKNQTVQLAVQEIHDAAEEEKATTDPFDPDGDGDDDSSPATDTDGDGGSGEPAAAAPPAEGEEAPAATTESLEGELQTADAVAETIVPLSAASFEETEVAPVEDLTEKAVLVGPEALENAVLYRFKALQQAIKSDKAYESLIPKFEVLKNRTAEAIAMGKYYAGKFDEIGLTPRGIFRKEDPIAVESARQIVVRFIKNRGKIKLNPTKPTNVMQAVESAFELVQLKQLRRQDPSKVDRETISTRESMLFGSITDFAETDRNKVTAIVEIGGIKMDNAFYPEFVRDTGMTIQERDVKDKAPSSKDELVDRILNRFELVFAKKPNKDNEEVIRAIVDGQEPYRLTNLYEKFLIAAGQKSLESAGNVDAVDMERRARVYTTLVKAVERLRLVDSKDADNLGSYLLEASI